MNDVCLISEALTPELVETARTLFQEYERTIGVDLCFQGFSEELASLPGEYARPRGGLFVAMQGLQPAGCVALRPFDIDGIAELKRLYVRTDARGHGFGLALTRTAIARAQSAGYTSLRLDTLPSMQEAQRLYRTLGFHEIAPYRFNPVHGVTYMELDLKCPAP